MTGSGTSSGSGPETFGAGGKFRFECHGGLPCFGKCCRDINIFLTPCDVIRLKKRLGLSSAEFLRIYTVDLELPGFKFSLPYLRMKEENLDCPFLSEGGCTVYPERPWSCRMAPVDLVGPGSFRIAFDREKCLGLGEDREWTVREWMDAQDMALYDTVESTFKEIPRLIGFTGREALDRRISQLFRMVSYDLDTFRGFIGRNRFLVKEAGLDREEFGEALKDDTRLLDAGVRWLIGACGSVKTLEKIDKILNSPK